MFFFQLIQVTLTLTVDSFSRHSQGNLDLSGGDWWWSSTRNIWHDGHVTRFGAKGGIGKRIAQCDCMAESSDSKYPTSKTSILYWCGLEKFFPGQGYCEGVVGRFTGLDVKFLGCLKKPFLTKRALLGASSPSGVNTKSDGQSPIVSSMTVTEPPSPGPYQSFLQHCESQERRPLLSSRRASPSLSPSHIDARPDPIHILLHKIVISWSRLFHIRSSLPLHRLNL